MLVLLFTRSLSGKFSRRSRGVQRQSSRNTSSAYFSYCEIPSPCGKTNLETAPVFPRRRLRLQFLLEELVAKTKTFRARHQIRNWVLLKTWPCTRLRHNVPASSRASYFRHSRNDSTDFLLRLNRTRSSNSEEFLVLRSTRPVPKSSRQRRSMGNEEFLTFRKKLYRLKFTKRIALIVFFPGISLLICHLWIV